ncbi:hypothetical protein BJF77_08750 [Kocuria sp. CNJ-770]|nr:hypothetical protein BJF77_08750 [Kocuria sp. CNJ-770]
MGKSATDPAKAVGSTSSGSCVSTLDTARSTWLRARSRSVPYSKPSWISDSPLREVDVELSRPSTMFRARSSGRPTCSSTTSAEDPGITETTLITGISREGMSSCFMERMLSTPKTATKTVMSTIRARLAIEARARRNTRAPRGGTVEGAPGRPGAGAPQRTAGIRQGAGTVRAGTGRGRARREPRTGGSGARVPGRRGVSRCRAPGRCGP